MCYAVLAPVSRWYPPVWGRLPTRYSPVRHWIYNSLKCKHLISLYIPFDLHVLGTPPAFILSQDQTLMFWFFPLQDLTSLAYPSLAYSSPSGSASSSFYSLRFPFTDFLPAGSSSRFFTAASCSLPLILLRVSYSSWIFRPALLFICQGALVSL